MCSSLEAAGGAVAVSGATSSGGLTLVDVQGRERGLGNRTFLFVGCSFVDHNPFRVCTIFPFNVSMESGKYLVTFW